MPRRYQRVGPLDVSTSERITRCKNSHYRYKRNTNHWPSVLGPVRPLKDALEHWLCQYLRGNATCPEKQHIGQYNRGHDLVPHPEPSQVYSLGKECDEGDSGDQHPAAIVESEREEVAACGSAIQKFDLCGTDQQNRHAGKKGESNRDI